MRQRRGGHRRPAPHLPTAAVLLAIIGALPFLIAPSSDHANAAVPFASDDFAGSGLGSRWEVVDPLGVGAAELTGGGQLALSVPAGYSHHPWGVDNSLRAVQSVLDEDLDVAARFGSMPSQRYQMQGLVVAATRTTFLRFDVHHDGQGLRLFVSTSADGAARVVVNRPLPELEAVSLRVVREDDRWRLWWSADGEQWEVAEEFTFRMPVATVGPFAGNFDAAGNAPAFTAQVDHVHTREDAVAPEIGDVAVDASTGNVVLRWTTSKTTTGRVEVVPTTTGQPGTEVDVPAGTVHSALLTGLARGTEYDAYIVATDDDGNTAEAEPAAFTTPVGNTGPTIDVWHSSALGFGPPGQGQDLVNVLGRVSDPEGVRSLTYSLNGGPPQSLSIGSDDRRLQNEGDFNVDIPFSSLELGSNVVTLAATDDLGAVSTRTVDVARRSAEPLDLPFHLPWQPAIDVTSQAQVVDGKWTVTDDGVRPVIPGYDRVVALGEVGWRDYELTVPVTVHEFGPGAFSRLSGAPMIGVGMRWDGHSAADSHQPAWQWWPTGAFAWYRFHERGSRLELTGNEGSPVERVVTELQFDTTYLFKVRVETAGQSSYYQVKLWPENRPEPVAWMATIEVTDGPDAGAPVLIAHQLDGTFGDVVVRSIEE